MNNQQLKDHTNKLLSGLEGIISYAESKAKESLAELKTKDPKLAAEKTKEFADAMQAGNMDEGFKNLKKQVEGMAGMFNGY